MKKNVIIFGGSGFVGSHIADAFTSNGYSVTIFDVNKSNYLQGGQKEIIGNILDFDTVLHSMKNESIVINCAGMADIEQCASEPLLATKINIMGNINLLEASVQNKINRFIFASSAYVYSSSGGIYKNTKQACELFIDTYHREYNLNYTIIRFGSLYGPRATLSNSIYKMIRDALLYNEIVYNGTGEEVREHIHIRDVADLTVKILSEEFKNKNVIFSGNYAMKYKDLLNMISEILGKKINIIYKSKTSDIHYEITPYSFSPKFAKKLFNNYYVDMGQGLLEIMTNINDNRGANYEN